MYKWLHVIASLQSIDEQSAFIQSFLPLNELKSTMLECLWACMTQSVLHDAAQRVLAEWLSAGAVELTKQEEAACIQRLLMACDCQGSDAYVLAQIAMKTTFSDPQLDLCTDAFVSTFVEKLHLLIVSNENERLAQEHLQLMLALNEQFLLLRRPTNLVLAALSRQRHTASTIGQNMIFMLNACSPGAFV